MQLAQQGQWVALVMLVGLGVVVWVQPLADAAVSRGSEQADRAGVSRMQLSRLGQAGMLSQQTHGVHLSRWVGVDHRTGLRAAWLSLDPTRTAAERLASSPTDLVVSHATAAEMLDLGSIRASWHEFTSPRRRQSRRGDARLHHRPVPREDMTVVDGLPVTTPARTVVDLLAQRHDTDHVAQLVGDATERGVLHTRGLAGRLAPYAAAHGYPRGDGEALLAALYRLAGIEPAPAGR